MVAVSADNSPPLAPPGLDVLSDLASTSSAAGVGFPPLTSDLQAFADRIRAAVLAEVDGKIKARMHEVLQSGKDMMNKMKQNTTEMATELRKELMQCQEKIKMLETEHHRLVQAMTPDKHASPPRIAYAKPSINQSPIRFPPVDLLEQPVTECAIFADAPPFPATPAVHSSPPQLLLEQALGGPTQRRPLSLAESLCPPASTEVSSAAACDAGPKVIEFTFTILKADGMDLGLSVAHVDSEQALIVEGVCQDGAVEAWNRQCSANASHKVVRRGDKIVSVNSVTKDPAKMLEECRNRRLLKLAVVRTVEAKPSGASSLRTEASVFVPMLQHNS
jgi:hypothetical protein